MSSQVRMRLLPSARCLFDEPVQLKVSGLRSRQVVTMRARSADERGVVFSSSATYRADGRGEIDLDRDPSLSGSYVGVEPMGLLWSMRPDILHKRFHKDKTITPHVVKLSVHEGEGEGRMLAEATNERLVMGEGVSRVSVKEGNFEGVLFTPPGKKFSSLCFDHIYSLLVGSKGVGILSRSKASDIALSIAAFVPGVEATMWINGCSANMVTPLYYKNKQLLPVLLYDKKKVVHTSSGAGIIKYVLNSTLTEENKATLIPIEQAKGHFLFVAAENDLNLDAKAYMEQLVERLKRHGKENFECVSYPGAGHYLEPPYIPFCPSSFHGVVCMPVLWGGDPRGHPAAEVLVWKKIQDYFRTRLSCDAAQ
uniref:acyl-coenzyme A thioesterase 2, mitochondrial-like n=1 Tax=Monopterus albus TaxID=43700 RepID=UPI0009B4D0B2|nr:acyl-coenzyme A thioesterase 2, mitochondrial-like [Monopterus albus]